MRSLLLKSAGFIALASAVAFACGDANRTFVNTEATGGMGGTDATGGMGGTGKGGKGGGAGTTSGTAGEAGSGADGGTAGSGAGRGGTGGTSTTGNAGEAGDTGVGGSTGGTNGGRGGTGNGGEGGEVIIDLDPGKPGVSMLPGGSWMTSETYKLFGVMSEGQIPVNSSSTHYVLHGSVIGATQPGDATQ